MIVTLVGYRGCGKSTVAPVVADLLGWESVDADLELQRRVGCSIRDIFENEGEPAFREYERATLTDLLTRSDLVLAAGGGAILRADTRHDFRKAGPVIWLTANPAVIFQRLSGDTITASQRPQLTNLPGLAEIQHLMGVREPLYRDVASLTLDTEHHDPQELARRIVEHVGLWSRPGDPT